MTAEDFQAYESKWLLAEPGFSLIRLFLPAAIRLPLTAFGCLAYEIEQATLHVSDDSIARAKLGWWAQELARARAGHPQHPLSAALFVAASVRELPEQLWTDMLTGAAAMRSNESADNGSELCQRMAGFCTPLATIEAELCGLRAGAGAGAAAIDLWTCGLLLREALRYSQLAASGRPLLPLDLLARHQVTRADLTQATANAANALRDFLGELDTRLELALRQPSAAPFSRRAQGRLDRLRIAKLLGCRDHGRAGSATLRPMTPRQLFAVWREARRQG